MTKRNPNELTKADVKKIPPGTIVFIPRKTHKGADHQPKPFAYKMTVQERIDSFHGKRIGPTFKETLRALEKSAKAAVGELVNVKHK